MPIKKATNKIKGLSRFTKFNILIFSLLFAGIGSYLVINSKAGSGGQFFISTTIDGQLVSGFQVQIKSVGATVGCDSNIASYGVIGPDWYGVTGPIPATDYGLQVYNCFTGSGNTKLYQITDAKAAIPRPVNFVGAQSRNALTGQWQTLPPPYYFNVYESPYTGQQGIRLLYTSITPPPPPPPASFSTDLTVRYNPIAYNSSTSMYWSSVNASTCQLKRSGSSWGPFVNAVVATGGGTQEQNPGALQSTTYFRVECNGVNGGAGAISSVRQVVVNAPAAVINSFGASPTSVNSGGTTTLSWNASNVSACVIANSSSSWFKTLSVSGTSSSGSVASPTLTTSDTFTIGCVGANGGAGATKSVGVSVNGQPPPPVQPQPCPTGYTGTMPNCLKHTTSTNTRVVTRTVTTPVNVNSSDKERPTVPENLMAEQAGNGEVSLSWDASTDNIGVVGYTVERSSDGTNWEMLDEAVVDTTYADNTAEFGTQYSYRVSAQDAAGNFSDYAVTDLLTNGFTPNVYPDQDSSITSEDGIVTVNIPAGALSEEAYCEVLKDSVSAKAPKGYKLAAGAYTIDCKNKDGDSITEFDKAATVVMDMKDFKQYKKFAVFSIDGSNLTNLNATYDSKDKTLTFKMTEFVTFAAYGAKGGSLWWLWLLILLLIGGLIFFIIRLRNSGNSDDSYYDTTSYVTMPPTQTVGPSGPEQHTSLPDMVAQGQQPQAGYPQDPYAQPPGYPGQQPPAGSGQGQQPPQYPS